MDLMKDLEYHLNIYNRVLRHSFIFLIMEKYVWKIFKSLIITILELYLFDLSLEGMSYPSDITFVLGLIGVLVLVFGWIYLMYKIWEH